MENMQSLQDEGSEEINVVDDWSSREVNDNDSTLQYIAIKMNNSSEDKNQTATLGQINPPSLETWSDLGETGNNSTLLYIAVQYINGGKPDETNTTSADQSTAQETYTDFTSSHVSPLDPNMISVDPYSPISTQYQENCNNSELAPIIIHQYVTQETPEEGFINQISSESSLENLPAPEMPTVLCSNDLQANQNQYLQMINNNDNVNICENSGMQLIHQQNDQQEVELLITDHATGISYSVNAQELLVDDPQLLEAITPNPMLESDGMFSLTDGNIRADLNDEAATSTVVTSVNEEMMKNYIDCLTNRNIGCSSDVKIHTRRNCLNSTLDDEENLLSCVYNICDKPILSRARASLPENYLSIVKSNEEDTVIAKRTIPKRTQFGPLQGVLDMCKQEELAISSFLLMIDENIYTVNVSDENNSNWMSFVRKAITHEEQNLIMTQEGNGLFFTATRNILPKEELKVGYSSAYARQFDLQILQPVEKESWPCYECSDKFSSFEELQNHIDYHDEELGRNERPKKKYRRTNAAKSNKTQMNVIECNVCHDLFDAYVSYKTLKNHLVDKHKCVVAKTAENFSVHQCFQCKVCNMRFKMEGLLNIHNLEHDSELSLDQPNHVCPQCQRKFPTRKQLVLHVPTHALPKDVTKDDSVKCHICHKYFSHSVRLQKHMLCHGSDENKPLQCKVCKKRFLTASALSFHSKGHIIGEKQFQCPICNERFDHVLKLRGHVHKHAVNNTFTCPICNKVFAKYNIIRKHIKFHSEKTHQCLQCNKAFTTKDTLKKHMLRHSDHREFLCADCGRQFKRKDKLAEHIQKLHLQPSGNRKRKVKVETVSRSSKEPTDFHRFIYKCHTCLVGFKRRGMLVNHLAKRHPDIRPDSVPELNLPILQTTKDYYCQYCDKVYKSSSKRKAHILKNHPGAALPENKPEKPNEQMALPPTFSASGSITTRPKKCRWCHRQYARKGKLLQHIRKAHPAKVLDEEPAPKEKHEKVEQKVVETPPVSNTINQLPEIDGKDIDADFIVNQGEGYKNVLDKNQTTDGNMTEIMPAVIDGLIDEDSKYCHLSIDENEMIQSGQLENHNAHFYHLLTANNGKSINVC